MPKSWNKQNKNETKSKHDYYMYKDGYSYWGVGLYRGDELPISCPVDIHKSTIEEKITWYEEQTNPKESEE